MIMSPELETWATLNKSLKILSEQECYNLLIEEYNNKKRMQFLIRIYGRYNILRTDRERHEIVTGAW